MGMQSLFYKCRVATGIADDRQQVRSNGSLGLSKAHAVAHETAIDGIFPPRIDDRHGVTLRVRHRLLSPPAKAKATVQQQNPCFVVVWASSGRKRRRVARTILARHKVPRA